MATFEEEKEKQSKKEYAYQYYLKKGLRPIEAAAIVGNLDIESAGFNSDVIAGINENKDNGSEGVAQWRLDRLQKLKSTYKDYRKLDNQLSFVLDELNTTHKSAYEKMKRASTVEEATSAFTWDYEKPNKELAHFDRRIESARKIAGVKADPNFSYSSYSPEYLSTYVQPTPGQLETSTVEYEEEPEVVEAKQDIAEKSLIEDFQNKLSQQQEQIEQLQASKMQEEQPQQQNQEDDFASVDMQDPYNYIQLDPGYNFEEEFQDGGIPVSSNGVYDYPGQKVMVPTTGSITMKDVSYPIQGISQETGEQKMMYPGQEYFYKNTDNVLEIPQLQKGGTVSEIYEQTTGRPWSTAREQGLTDGSAEANLKLIQNLKNPTQNSTTSPSTFNEAFKKARTELGANKIFEFEGKKYGTNLQGEEFNPNKEDIVKNNLPVNETLQRLREQNSQVSSLYSSKKTTKLEPQYEDWEKIKLRNKEMNSKSNADKIISYQSSKPDEQYLVVDKTAGRMHLYRGKEEVGSYKVGTGENFGDEQTRTWVDKETKKTDWSKGNKRTGAGIYEITGSTAKNEHYSNVPSFNMKNEYGIEVPMAIHAAGSQNRVNKISDNDPNNNRVSNGCINGLCNDLKDLYKKDIKPGTKVYVLPDEDSNEYVYENGKLNFKSKNPNVNRTVNTLNYKPIKLGIDEKRFKKEVFQWNDLNDEEEYEKTTKPFVKSLETNKQKIMKAAKINGDVYNEIAKVAFGIYGTESNFGDTHSSAGNLGRAVGKAFNKSSSSSPDYESKYNTYGATGDNRSVGLTQIRFSYLNNDERKALKEVGIVGNSDFLDPEKAALGTAIVLGVRYNQQLTEKEKKDIINNLPKKWNTRGNYTDRIKKNASYLNINQLN